MGQTAEQVITRAYSIARIKKGNTPIEEKEFEIGIDTYNDVISMLQIDGISLGASEVSKKEDDTEVPIFALEMIKTQLAIRLTDEFNRAATGVLIERADRALRAVRRMLRRQRGSAFPNTLPVGSGNYSGDRNDRFFPDRDCGDIKSGNNDFMLDDQGQVIQDDSDCARGDISSIGDANG